MEATKDRILNAGSELFCVQGYAGTGIKQILLAANTSFGSLYHFFPGGKEHLGTEVIRQSGALYIERFVDISVQAHDTPDAVGRFFEDAANRLRESDFADASSIATMALEATNTNEPLRRAAAEVFDGWVEIIAEYLVTRGVAHRTARRLSFAIPALMEGALVLARTMRSLEPLDRAREIAEAEVAAACHA